MTGLLSLMCLLVACHINITASSCPVPEIYLEASKLFCHSPSQNLNQSASIWLRNGTISSRSSSNNIALSLIEDQTILQCALLGTDGIFMHLSRPVKYYGRFSFFMEF